MPTKPTANPARDPRLDAALGVAEDCIGRWEGKERLPVTDQELAAFGVIVCALRAPAPPGSPFGPGPAEVWAAEFRSDKEIHP